jgi:hypothetical protein
MHLQIDDDQYEVALERLKNTFGNEKQLQKHYREVIKDLTLRQLVNTTPIAESRKCHDNSSSAKESLMAIGIERQCTARLLHLTS